MGKTKTSNTASDCYEKLVLVYFVSIFICAKGSFLHIKLSKKWTGSLDVHVEADLNVASRIAPGILSYHIHYEA